MRPENPVVTLNKDIISSPPTAARPHALEIEGRTGTNYAICSGLMYFSVTIAGLFRPTPGRVAPEGEGEINRNIPTRHDIMNLLPVESPEVLFSTVT